MTNACRELEVALTLHAAGTLAADEAAAVEQHLARCAPCRGAAAAARDVLALVQLPAPSPAEERALRDLPRTVPAALRRAERRRAGARWAALAAVAAAASLALVAQRPGRERGGGDAAGSGGWEPPSIETLWRATDVLEVADAPEGAEEANHEPLAGNDPGEEEP